MPHIEYFVVSQSISIDQDKNRVSIFHIFEELSFKKFPGRIPMLVITTLWDISDEERDREFEGEIILNPPDIAEPIRYPFRFRTDKIAPRQRVIYELKNTSVPGVGEFRFEVFLEGRRHAGHTIHIRETEKQSIEEIENQIQE
jgi:hypothetical protein